MCTTHFDPENNEPTLREDLDLLEKVRDEASIKMAARQQQLTNYYNNRVRPRSFKLGDLVIRHCQASRQAREHRKLSPNWESQYKISVKVIGRGAYKLAYLDGKAINNTWNAQHLAKYFQ